MDARDATLALLAAKDSGRTICPSDVAKVLAADQEASGSNWREKMPEVHVAVDCLLAEGLVRLSWKGSALSKRTGPYRIRRAEPD